MENISYQNSNNSDLISDLPVDKNEPTKTEIQIVDTIFTKHKKTINTLFSEAKESIIVGILFLIFSIPTVDVIIKRIIPVTNNSTYILLLIKILFVMVLFWVLKHFYLSRKT
jgi:uncharacterized membrane protein